MVGATADDVTDVHRGRRRLGRPLSVYLRARELHGGGRRSVTGNNDDTDVVAGIDGGKSHDSEGRRPVIGAFALLGSHEKGEG
ncbi:hypothetical protein AHAS_Ahas06G0159500 [Arachis hypogaea]